MLWRVIVVDVVVGVVVLCVLSSLLGVLCCVVRVRGAAVFINLVLTLVLATVLLLKARCQHLHNPHLT